MIPELVLYQCVLSLHWLVVLVVLVMLFKLVLQLGDLQNAGIIQIFIVEVPLVVRVITLELHTAP